MNIFILTGAGISAESGLGTFRDAGGIWARFDPMKLATPEAFAAHPDRVHEFYNLRRSGLCAASPNAAHVALARLESGLVKQGGSVFLCTQNIDDLHERGGSKQVHHMHGELLRSLCARCGKRTDCRHDLDTGQHCRSCGQPGGLRPDVVWFGEMPYGLAPIDEALEAADLFVAVGTSGEVYPAAGYVEQARDLGIPTCEINLATSGSSPFFDRHISGPASETVPVWVNQVLLH